MVDPSLFVYVHGYSAQENVICFLPARASSFEQSCRSILNTMPVSRTVTTFGFDGSVADVTVPYRLWSGMSAHENGRYLEFDSGYSR